MQRTRGERRCNNVKKAIRKRNITRSWGWSTEYYDNLHQYSKNKIHCSCPLCAAKTRNKCRSRRKMWQKSLNWSISDMKKIMKMKENVRPGGTVPEAWNERMWMLSCNRLMERATVTWFNSRYAHYYCGSFNCSAQNMETRTLAENHVSIQGNPVPQPFIFISLIKVSNGGIRNG